jgi:hypothetical protein
MGVLGRLTDRPAHPNQPESDPARQGLGIF